MEPALSIRNSFARFDLWIWPKEISVSQAEELLHNRESDKIRDQLIEQERQFRKEAEFVKRRYLNRRLSSPLVWPLPDNFIFFICAIRLEAYGG